MYMCVYIYIYIILIIYYTILYYTILYYTILYYTILYYTILYYTIPRSGGMVKVQFAKGVFWIPEPGRTPWPGCLGVII